MKHFVRSVLLAWQFLCWAVPLFCAKPQIPLPKLRPSAESQFSAKPFPLATAFSRGKPK